MKVHNKHAHTAPPDAIYVGRGSLCGNPFKIGQDGTREEVIQKFEDRILPRLDVSHLKGKDLVCFCAPLPCHADVLMKKANS